MIVELRQPAELRQPERSQSIVPYSWIAFLMVKTTTRGAYARRRREREVALHDGHSLANRKPVSGLQLKSLILDINFMVNWHLSKQGIPWSVSGDYIVGASFDLIEVTRFLKVTADQVPALPLNHELNLG